MNTDPIADLLTRIRNAGAANHSKVTMPNSKVKTEIVRVLKEEGYVDDFSHSEGLGAGHLTVVLRYYQGKHAITGIRRTSKPGQRSYVGAADIPVVMNSLGVAVLTTSQGVMTGSTANEKGVGGEVICTVW
jgi:small subunit ribosomal protein S8